MGDRVAHARLAEALRGHATVWCSDDPLAVAERAVTGDGLAATVIAFAPTRLDEALRGTECLRAHAPDHAIIGYVDPRTLSSRFILETGRADLTDLVLRDVDDSRAVLLRVLQNAEQRGSALRVADRMCEGQERDVRVLVQFICRRLREPLEVPAIAAGLGLNRRTLYHRLGAVGSPGPRELVGWCKVLFVAHQLSSTTLPLAAIATQLDMPSWRTLSYMVRRYLGVGTNTLRTVDAFERALAQFRAQFHAPSRAPVQPSPIRRHAAA
jgi:AraC-like DNA-binding protein